MVELSLAEDESSIEDKPSQVLTERLLAESRWLRKESRQLQAEATWLLHELKETQRLLRCAPYWDRNRWC